MTASSPFRIVLTMSLLLCSLGMLSGCSSHKKPSLYEKYEEQAENAKADQLSGVLIFLKFHDTPTYYYAKILRSGVPDNGATLYPLTADSVIRLQSADPVTRVEIYSDAAGTTLVAQYDLHSYIFSGWGDDKMYDPSNTRQSTSLLIVSSPKNRTIIIADDTELPKYLLGVR